MNASEYIKGKIKELEGYSETPYPDGIGYSVGWGHWMNTANPTINQPIGIVQATNYFNQDIAIAEAAVNKYVTVPLTQNQFDALVSFVYNVGSGNFANSDLLKAINQRKGAAAIKRGFLNWSHHGVLTKRREFESELYAGLPWYSWEKGEIYYLSAMVLIAVALVYYSLRKYYWKK